MVEAVIGGTTGVARGGATPAARGRASMAVLHGPLTSTHKRTLDLPSLSVKDYEWVQTWRLDRWTGPILYSEKEVQAVEWVSVEDVGRRMAATPELFTPWFKDEFLLIQLGLSS